MRLKKISVGASSKWQPEATSPGEESLVAGGMQAGQPGGLHWRQHALVSNLAGLFCSDASSLPRVKQLCCCHDWVTELSSNSEVSLRCELLHVSPPDHECAPEIHCCFSGMLKLLPLFRGHFSGQRDDFFLNVELAALSLSGGAHFLPFLLAMC